MEPTMNTSKRSSAMNDGADTHQQLQRKDLDKDDIEHNDVKIRYPKSIFFIVVNEFCERFCFYGMKTVLILYLRDYLGFNEDDSVVLYHTFNMLCYFTPIFGAILSDNYIGKFNTILYLSIVYACGSTVLAGAAIPHGIPQVAFSMVGLFLIAVGTGGIKPCVTAFGGDQFVRPQQDRQLEQFFSIFYLTMNIGALISSYVTPILREDVHCFGENSCYSIAFGLPALLMIIAIIIFACGKPLYKIKLPEGNIMIDFCKCIWRGIVRRFTAKGEKHDHWLDYAGDVHDKQLIEDSKQVLAVGWLFLPLPTFMALYAQQGSRWIFQATRMNGDLGGGFVLKPDQVQMIDPILIFILVPLLEGVIYPLFDKYKLLTALQKIASGMILCGVAFIISGLVEISIQPTYEKLPGSNMTQLNFINALPCPVNLNYTVRAPNNDQFHHQGAMILDDVFKNNATEFFPSNKEIQVSAYLSLTNGKCGNLSVTEAQWKNTLGETSENEGYAVLITLRQGKLTVAQLNDPEQLRKSSSGQPMIGFLVNLNENIYENGTFWVKQWRPKGGPNGTGAYDGYISNPFNYYSTSDTTPFLDNILYLDSQEVEIGSYDILWKRGENQEVQIGTVNNLIQGGVYSIVIQEPLESLNTGNTLLPDVVFQVEVTTPNSVSIAWLFPQYFFLTLSEIMFSVTGMKFSFTQAPMRMKSVVMAMWLLVAAVGNLIIIIVASVHSGLSNAEEYFLFAGIMGIAVIIFTIMALPYKYANNAETDEKSKEKMNEDDGEKKNLSINESVSSTDTESLKQNEDDDSQ